MCYLQLVRRSRRMRFVFVLIAVNYYFYIGWPPRRCRFYCRVSRFSVFRPFPAIVCVSFRPPPSPIFPFADEPNHFLVNYAGDDRCRLKSNMPFADRWDPNKSKLTDRIRGKSTDEILEEINREFGNTSGNSMFFDKSDARTSPQRVR